MMGQVLLKEIHEQPRAIRDSLSALDEVDLGSVVELPVKRVVLMGMGSSYNAALYGQHLFSQLTSSTAQACLSSDYLYYQPRVEPEDLVILVSQSGETVETVRACRLLKEKGFRRVLALTNTEESTLTKLSRVSLLTKAGEERASSTKTYLSALAVLNLLVRSIGSQVGALSPEAGSEARLRLMGLADLLDEKMDSWRKLSEEIAERVNKASTRFLLARGPNIATARTGALLFKEASKLWVEASDAAEFRHEALELVRSGFTAILLAAGPTRDPSAKLAADMERLGAEAQILFPEDLGMGEGWSEDLTVFPYTVLIELAAYSSALRRGVDPDVFAVMRKVTLEE